MTGKQKDVENHILLEIGDEAVVVMGSGDTFKSGIEKYVRSFIPSSHWRDREEAFKSIQYNEPEPYKGTWSAELYVKGRTVKVIGNFRIINNCVL